MKDMPNYPTPQSILVDLDLDKVSLCNQGANSRAHILLTKRKENQSMPKTFEELMKALTEEQVTLVTAHIADIEKAKDEAITKLTDDVTTLNGEVDTLKKAVPAVEQKPDEILKNASPALAAYIETLQKSVSTLVADKEENVAKARFEIVKALPVDPEELKTVLKSASPATFEILKKAAAAIEAGILKGKGMETPGDTFGLTADKAFESLEKSAKKIALEKSITFEQGFTEACNADPETYAKYVKGDN